MQKIKKAELSCKNSEINSFDHFVGIDKMVQISSGATRKQEITEKEYSMLTEDEKSY